MPFARAAAYPIFHTDEESFLRCMENGVRTGTAIADRGNGIQIGQPDFDENIQKLMLVKSENKPERILRPEVPEWKSVLTQLWKNHWAFFRLSIYIHYFTTL